MTFGDKIKHAGEDAIGKVKEAAGHVTGNEDLEARGEAEQAKANVKQAGDDVKDAGNKLIGN
ncbi:CsbD family protein [Nakamurella antarctica]|uniref:CsbD family protein n=1 Tax=Nakamurella antarctica TaxID=1902245 RepID=A0A3G8ZL38_9ACTN|nr:CsbD family protein [Nakamurella antarctica]AZI58039.1 CsbD family protein [Nakamurella antarctica]